MADEDFDAREEAMADMKAKAIESLIKNCPEFVWKWRIVKSMDIKIKMINSIEERKKFYKRYKHLDNWCEEAINEEIYAIQDAAEEAANPYKYRGLSRSMFM